MAKKNTETEKLGLKTKDLTKDNIEKLSKLFPELLTEVEREGKIIKTINADRLKELVGDFAVDDEEIYQLSWVGKRDSKRKIAEPIIKTLRPIAKDSVDFENTKNLYIEGDNFEVLKLLKESYLNSIKMIYIDPPYNTGKDFVYKDNFTKSREEYDVESKAVDEEGNKLFKNTTTNGRFHSDWLSMMFERLTLARDLLKDDGAIFISIDDNEVANLRKICDEIFGEGNFVANFIWEKTFRPSNFANTTRKNTEYILVYSKSDIELKGAPEDTKGDFSLTKKKHSMHVLKCPANYVNAKFEDGVYKKGDYAGGYELLDDIIVNDGKIKNEFRIKVLMSIWSQAHLNEEINKGVYLAIKNKNTMALYARKTYQQSELKPTTLIPRDLVGDVLEANKEINNLFKINLFEYPKPTSLIKYLTNISTENRDIILDFFAGSGTTAHAVMQLNAEDGGNRRFVMVQLPEETDKESEAFKAGYKNICEIGKERIRRAAKKIKEKLKEKNKQTKLGDTKSIDKLDLGFKVFKIDSSNMKDVYYNPNQIDQRTLTNYKDNIKDDRTSEDLLYQVLLDLAIPISAKVKTEKIKNKKVFVVETDSGENWLVACFDEGVNQDLIKELAELKPLRIVFRDSSFKNDSDKVNCEEFLKHKLPNTQMRVI